MRVQRPLVAWDTDDPAAIKQMVEYTNQCESDIAKLAAMLWNLYENKLEPDKLHIILNRPETRVLIAKHKGGQDE